MNNRVGRRVDSPRPGWPVDRTFLLERRESEDRRDDRGRRYRPEQSEEDRVRDLRADLAAEEREIERLLLEKRLRGAKQLKRELLDEMEIDPKPREPPAQAQAGADRTSAPLPDTKQIIPDPISRPPSSAIQATYTMNRKTSKLDIVKRANMPLLQEKGAPAQVGEEEQKQAEQISKSERPPSSTKVPAPLVTKAKAGVIDPVKLQLKLEQERAKQAKTPHVVTPAFTPPVNGQFVAVQQVLNGQGMAPKMEITILPEGVMPEITEGWQGYWRIEK